MRISDWSSDVCSSDLYGAEHQEGAEDAQRKAEIAHAVDDERLDRRRIGAGLVIPEADQQIGGEPHAFPAEEHLDEIVRRHQHQHLEGEQREIGERSEEHPSELQSIMRISYAVFC